MLVYRIATHKRAQSLTASGRAARWNPNEVDMIYTASSRSLACLENVVHRTQLGVNSLFSVMTIEVPDHLAIEKILLSDLPVDWKTLESYPITQAIGIQWIKSKNSPILEVPSAIIAGEVNYLINPKHSNFALMKLLSVEPFMFDTRIKA